MIRKNECRFHAEDFFACHKLNLRLIVEILSNFDYHGIIDLIFPPFMSSLVKQRKIESVSMAPSKHDGLNYDV